jgi:hypothetical protein
MNFECFIRLTNQTNLSIIIVQKFIRHIRSRKNEKFIGGGIAYASRSVVRVL